MINTKPTNKDSHLAFEYLFSKYGMRMNIENICDELRCQRTDAQFVANRTRLLPPLGNPKTNSVKWFCTYTIAAKVQDEAWVNKVVETIQEFGRQRTK